MLVFNPTIPDRWKSYSFGVAYRGSIIRVDVSQEGARLKVTEGAPVQALIRGQVREIDEEGLTL
jgi:maltose phosphorylase